ncbi:DinB family protein [Janibacter terrae]
MSDTQRAEGLVDASGRDPRSPQDPAGDERTMLTGFLRRQRETLEAKCAGLGPEQLAERAVEPSTISLLGLVRHMARVERGWFRQCVEGEDVATLFRGPGNMDGEWDDAVGTRECVDEAFAAWRAECRSSDAIIAARGLEDTFVDHSGWPWNLRSLLGHMIEEYARHLGHADLLRERIDGRLGE